MKILRHLPNALTCSNLVCGCLGILSVLQTNPATNNGLVAGSYFLFAAAIFDFLDGFVARLLGVSSAIGKELDSLADCVTFGVLPSFILYQLLGRSWASAHSYWPYAAFSIAVFSALRLAKFNIDTRQSEQFIGVPTTAIGPVVASFPMILAFQPQYGGLLQNPYFLVGFVAVSSFLLVSEIKIIALKFKGFGWSQNQVRYIFIGTSAVLLLLLRFAAVPLIVVLQIIFSIIFKSKL